MKAMETKGKRASLLSIVLAMLLVGAGLAGAALAAPGNLDPAFGAGGKVTTDNFGAGSEKGRAVAVQPDGKIVAAGHSWNGTNRDFALARYNPDGSLDTTFESDGKTTTDFFVKEDIAYSVALQPDGKIIVAGYADKGGNYEFALARFNANGSLDTGFDGDGRVTTDFGSNRYDVAYGVAVQPDGKIVAAGYTATGLGATSNDIALARYNSNGSLDTGFDGDGRATADLFRKDDYARSVAIQSDGKIVIAGSTSINSDIDFALARFDADGSLDTSFGSGGTDGDGKTTTDFFSGRTNIAWSVALQTDGKIVAAGHATPGSDTAWTDFALARYNPDGSLDSSFGSGGPDGDGKTTTDFFGNYDEVHSLAIQPNGKIAAAGFAYKVTSSPHEDFALARYNADGSPDVGFDGDGRETTDFFGESDEAYGVAVQPDGKIVAVGHTYNGSNEDFALARYDGDAASLPDATPPTVSLTAPQDGATVSGSSVTLSADASDNVAVTKVEFLVDGQVVGTDTSAPYSVSWDSTTMTDGSATIKARAHDAARNAETSRAVVVDNTYPQTTISSGPAEGSATQQTSASFSFTSSERDSTFRCKLDGGSFSVCSSPKEYSGLQPGSHTFTVYAVGAGGEARDSDSTPATRAWMVEAPPQDTTQPSVSLTAPDDGAVVGGASVALSADASDNVGVSRVEFLVNGNVVGTDASAPYTFDWNPDNVSDGRHTVTARAFDAAGNQRTSASKEVVVDNFFPNSTITSGPADGSFTRGDSASFSFTSTDADGSFRCKLDDRPAETCSSGKSYSGLAQGRHTFTVWAVGSAGEEADTEQTPSTRSWTVDSTAPSGSVRINGGAASTKSLNVTLSPSATDNPGGSGVSQMRFSNDGANWSGWQTHATSTRWKLKSGKAGTRAVYVQYMDRAGNASTVVRDTIKFVVKKKKKKR